MRSITYDEKKRYIIINLHLEEVFHNLFTFKSNLYIEGKSELINDDKGIYQSTLSQSTILYLSNNVPSVKDYSFFLMMNRIEEFGTNAFRTFIDFIKKITDSNTAVTISGIRGKIYKEIEKSCSDPYTFSEVEKKKISLVQFVSEDQLSLVDEKNSELWKSILQTRVCEDNCRELYDAISHSSPVKLKYYFNIKPLFTDTLFLCNAIYYLALKLNDAFDIKYSKNNRNKCLLAMSMNGMTICSLLSQLFEVDIIRIDHLGPYNELYLSSFERFVDPKKEYYIVSDVICMGREISDAKAVLKMFGAKCQGVISFINIVPVGKKDINTYSLINIDKDNNEVYKYGINTDLNY